MRKLLGITILMASAAAAFACGETEPENRAPVAVGAIPALAIPEGIVFTDDVSQFFEDPDGDPLTYAAKPSDAAVLTASVTGDSVTVTAVGAGMATITVTATDPGGLSAMQAAMITVEKVNRAPKLNLPIEDMEIPAGEETRFLLSYHFHDPDGDDLTYAAGSSDAGVVSVEIDEWEIVVSAAATGTAEITATATDPGDLSASDTFTVTVQQEN